ncbi:MAG: response regulator [Phycisphaeraceae bacterium]
MVEDDAAARDALQHLFRHDGWEVTVAANLRDGLVALTRPVDWVVLDLLLPDGDGVQVLEFIRRKRMRCRVAVVTGVTDQKQLRHVAGLEPEVLLTKPVDFEQLLRIIERTDADADGGESI